MSRTHNGKLGILGGSFNPVHYGHLRIAEEARIKLGFDKVIFIPSYNPPLKTEDLAEADHRYEMTRLAVESNPFFGISDVERRRGGKSYMADTLEALKDEYPGKNLHLILGIDSFLEIPSWHRSDRVMGAANFVVVSRPGGSFKSLSSRLPGEGDALSRLDRNEIEIHESVTGNGRRLYLLNVIPMSISATALRALVKEGASIKYLLPESVESYIISNKLYGRE